MLTLLHTEDIDFVYRDQVNKESISIFPTKIGNKLDEDAICALNLER